MTQQEIQDKAQAYTLSKYENKEINRPYIESAKANFMAGYQQAIEDLKGVLFSEQTVRDMFVQGTIDGDCFRLENYIKNLKKDKNH